MGLHRFFSFFVARLGVDVFMYASEGDSVGRRERGMGSCRAAAVR